MPAVTGRMNCCWPPPGGRTATSGVPAAGIGPAGGSACCSAEAAPSASTPPDGWGAVAFSTAVPEGAAGSAAVAGAGVSPALSPPDWFADLLRASQEA